MNMSHLQYVVGEGGGRMTCKKYTHNHPSEQREKKKGKRALSSKVPPSKITKSEGREHKAGKINLQGGREPIPIPKRTASIPILI